MSYRAQDWAEHVTGIPWATKGVLLLLANRHNGETGQCNPSEEWLCQRTELEPRTIRMHLKVLEDAKLITRRYKHGGRGVGRSVDGFDLHLGIQAAVKAPENDVLQDNEIATAESCHGKNTSLPRQNTATPYKEEPEENRKNKGRNVVSPAFESAWKLYLSCPNRASSQKKKSAAGAWAGAVKRAGSEDRILKAIAAAVDARTGAEGFVPALPHFDRWLKRDEWQDVEREHGTGTPEDVSLDAWRNAMRGFVDHGTWPGFLGPKPGEPGCRVPEGMIRHWQRMGAAA